MLAAFARRELSPVEVLDGCLERIAANGAGSFWAMSETARDEAAAAERSWAGGTARRLEGVPIAVKDLFDTAGIETTYGSRMFRGHVPRGDAEAVRLVREAGAVVVGKTATHEFAWGLSGVNEAMGTPRNPAHPDRVPGGSSAGSAAALAGGEVPLALGTDTGGSIRVPAAFCGVVGFKPAFGKVSLDGCWPLAPTLDHAGPMARTVADLKLLYEVLSGETVGEDEPPEDVRHDDTPDVLEIYKPLQLAEAVHVHRGAGLWPSRAGEYGSDVAHRMRMAEEVTFEEYLDATADRLRLGFQGVLVSPMPLPPPLLEDHLSSREQVARHVVYQDLLGLPALSLGDVQVTARTASEVFAVAGRLEEP